MAKGDERIALAKLVRLMTAFGLLFVQDRTEDGQLSFRIEPCVLSPACRSQPDLSCIDLLTSSFITMVSGRQTLRRLDMLCVKS